MHSSYRSRGRIFFEVLCAFAMVTSCVGAWRQTGASALLLGAAVAALYGLVHLFDMRRPRPAEAVEPQRIDFEPESTDIIVPMVAAEEQPVARVVAEPSEVVDAAVPRAGPGRRSGGSRKTNGRRAKPAKAAKVVELALVEEPAGAAPMTDEAIVLDGVAPSKEEFAFVPDEEAAPSPIEPLFEPEPFARMPRRAFGRRGQL
jgi:hypothetical protein